MYIREAHPSDGWQSPQNKKEGIIITDPTTMEERRKVAKEFAAQFKVSLPILVDGMDDAVGKAFAAWPDRIYVIGIDGKLAFKGDPGPRGFQVSDVPPVLKKLMDTNK